MYPFQYSISTADMAPPTAPILLTGTVTDNLRRAAQLGYQAIEVHTRDDAAIDVPEVLDVCAEARIAISAIVTGRLNTEGGCSLISDIPYVSAAAEEGMRRYIDMASRLHTDVIIGWVKGQIPLHGHRRTYTERLARSLQRLGPYAAERSVRLHLEVINRYETNYLSTAQEMMDFLDEYRLENCYAHLDTFHMAIEESDPAEAILRCGARLGYFHAADNTRRYPGSGTLDFAKLLQTLKTIHYSGFVSVECLPIPTGEIAAAQAITYLKGLAEQL